jgi:hypothetical protein
MLNYIGLTKNKIRREYFFEANNALRLHTLFHYFKQMREYTVNIKMFKGYKQYMLLKNVLTAFS